MNVPDAPSSLKVSVIARSVVGGATTTYRWFDSNRLPQRRVDGDTQDRFKFSKGQRVVLDSKGRVLWSASRVSLFSGCRQSFHLWTPVCICSTNLSVYRIGSQQLSRALSAGPVHSAVLTKSHATGGRQLMSQACRRMHFPREKLQSGGENDSYPSWIARG